MSVKLMESAGRQAGAEIPASPSLDLTSERRMWTAVLRQAFEEWRSSNVRARNAAEKFLLEDHDDFATVCIGAGLNPESLRTQLLKMRRKTAESRPSWRPLAA